MSLELTSEIQLGWQRLCCYRYSEETANGLCQQFLGSICKRTGSPWPYIVREEVKEMGIFPGTSAHHLRPGSVGRPEIGQVSSAHAASAWPSLINRDQMTRYLHWEIEMGYCHC